MQVDQTFIDFALGGRVRGGGATGVQAVQTTSPQPSHPTWRSGRFVTAPDRYDPVTIRRRGTPRRRSVRATDAIIEAGPQTK